MGKIILFSPLGMTDPIRNNHDGPLLQICRKYKPDVIYLFMSQEVCDIDSKDNRYELCIQKLSDRIG